MHKRGQAALEFLSTYGFAFLIILVMVGALTYFGVLKPQNIIPERCILGREFECNDFQLQTLAPNDATLRVQVVNQLGNTITFCTDSTGPQVTGCPAIALNQAYEVRSTGFGCTRSCTAAPGTIAGGAQATITCPITLDDATCAVAGGATFPAVGEKIKTSVRFNYIELGGAFPHTVQGEVLATLQQ